METWAHAKDPALIPVKKGGKYGYINTSGKFVIEPQFDSAASFSEGLAVIEMDSKEGFIDIIYREAGGFYEGWSDVKLNDKWFFINKKGKNWGGPDLSVSGMVKFGLILVNDWGKMTVYNTRGKVVYQGE